MTSQREILVIIAATVLLLNYMFDVMCKITMFLRQSAVLAPIICSLTYQCARGSIHVSCDLGLADDWPSA